MQSVGVLPCCHGVLLPCGLVSGMGGRLQYMDGDLLDGLDLLVKKLEDYIAIIKLVQSKQTEIEEVLLKSKQEEMLFTNVSKILVGFNRVEKNFENLRVLTMWVRKR